MKLSVPKLRELAGARGMNLTELLRAAGVSRNALYSLARKETVLPESVRRITRALGVPPTRFLEETGPPDPVQGAYRILEKVDRVAARHRQVDRDNVRHTLLLLREEPLTRLRRALQRGQRIDIHR